MLDEETKAHGLLEMQKMKDDLITFAASFADGIPGQPREETAIKMEPLANKINDELMKANPEVKEAVVCLSLMLASIIDMIEEEIKKIPLEEMNEGSH